ncbi:MAG: DUF721 domain-containing protein, partial [Planctomycetota bacterium]
LPQKWGRGETDKPTTVQSPSGMNPPGSLSAIWLLCYRAGMSSSRPGPRARSAGAPPTLGAALAELIRLKGVAGSGENAQLARDWRAAAGDRIADRTRPIGVRHGVLHVGVQNSALLGELASFHKENLLSAMQQRMPETRLRGLKFKLNGELRKPPTQRPHPTAPPDPAADDFRPTGLEPRP